MYKPLISFASQCQFIVSLEEEESVKIACVKIHIDVKWNDATRKDKLTVPYMTYDSGFDAETC